MCWAMYTLVRGDHTHHYYDDAHSVQGRKITEEQGEERDDDDDKMFSFLLWIELW